MVSPACAGMIPDMANPFVTGPGEPRMRGDDPQAALVRDMPIK